jgi:DNA end-binding protein Ku
VRFHLLHDQDHARLQRRMVCSADGKEVHPEHMVRGYEIARDQYVVVQQEELEALQPRKTKAIEIEDFVDLDSIDPVYFDRTYYVAPQEAGTRAYRLLVEAMGRAQKVGIARFVMHSKEYLAALRPVEGMLCLETMHFADEVMPLEQVGPPPAVKTDDRELKVAQQIIDSLSTEFEPDRYHDEYRKSVEDLIQRKAAGEQIVRPPEPKEAPARVANLMEALEASLARARKAARGQPAPPASSRQKPAPGEDQPKGRRRKGK